MKVKSSASREFPRSEVRATNSAWERAPTVGLTYHWRRFLSACCRHSVLKRHSAVPFTLPPTTSTFKCYPCPGSHGQIAFYTIDNDSDTSEAKNKSCCWNFSEIWWKPRNRRFSYQRGIWLKLQAQFSFKKLSQECFTYLRS